MLSIESQFSERVDSGYLAGKAPVTSHLKIHLTLRLQTVKWRVLTIRLYLLL